MIAPTFEYLFSKSTLTWADASVNENDNTIAVIAAMVMDLIGLFTTPRC